MFLSSTNEIHGKRVLKHLDLVKGNTIRARHLGRDILAILRNIVGGEITDYTKLMGEAREQALDRMIEDARNLGANAILHIEFSTAEIMGGAAEILVYGTAVIVEDGEQPANCAPENKNTRD
ncbi:YbjQ family protein [Planctomycetota bacterium]